MPSEPTRMLVCGSRNWVNWEFFEDRVSELADCGYEWIISGGAPGADTMAERAAKKFNFNLMVFRARWWLLGEKAGPIRNQQMLDEGKPDLVVAFQLNESKGTQDMLDRAKKAGVPTLVYTEKDL